MDKLFFGNSIITMNLIKKNFEQSCWFIGLLFLFFLNPTSSDSSICIFKLVGFNFCPGCGIGHSIHYTLHLNFLNAYREHILGIPLTLLLVWQILKPILKTKNTFYGPAITNDVERNSA